MRTLSTAAQAALTSRTLPMAVLVEMALTLPVNLSSANVDITYAGTTYLGTRGLGMVEAVRDTAAEMPQLRFELSGVPSTHIALALAEPVQGKTARIKVALFDPSTYQILVAQQIWAGYLDVMAIEDGENSAKLSVTAEHAGIDLMRPVTSLYQHDEQQRLAPGDLAFQYVSDQAEMRVVWPAASWGKQ